MHRCILRYWGSHFKTRRQVHILAEEFRPMVARGWHCHLVLEREPDCPSWLIDLKRLGIAIHLVPRPSRRFDLKCIRNVLRLCLAVRPDVLICENIHDSPLIGATLARVRAKVWIKRSMNSDFELGIGPTLWNRLALTTRLSCSLATRVIAVSSAVRDELVGLGITNKKILVRPNPRRLGQQNAVNRDAVRRSFGISSTDVVWASVGHAVPVKGWDMLIRAFHQVAASDSRAKLLLIGSLDHAEEIATANRLHAEISHLNLTGRVMLTGHVEDVSSILCSADAFVQASHSEGFSNALIEALEAGLPCLATRVGIATEVIQHGVNGLLVDRFHEESLAQALIELSRDDTLRSAMARNARVPDSIPSLQDYAQRLADDLTALRSPS